MEYQFEDYVQQAWDQIEMWAPPQDQIAQALTEQIRLLVGIDLNERDADMEFRCHNTLRF